MYIRDSLKLSLFPVVGGILDITDYSRVCTDISS
jgi:hypothetical protein